MAVTRMRSTLARAALAAALLAGTASLTGAAAEARIRRHHGLRFWYSGGYGDPARGTYYRGRLIPNTHDPHRFIHGPGVVVRH